MTKLARHCVVLVFGAAQLLSGVASGQVMRDPTQPPAAFMAPPAASRAPIDDFKFEHLVTVNGVRYLVWNSRRYTVGDTINGSRI